MPVVPLSDPFVGAAKLGLDPEAVSVRCRIGVVRAHALESSLGELANEQLGNTVQQ